MKFTKFTRESLAYRRQRRDLTANGYKILWSAKPLIEYNEEYESVVIGVDGTTLFAKTKPARR